MSVSRADIEAAARRIHGRVLRTPLRYSAALSTAADAEVFLKLETLQPTFSYKIRGATNAVRALQERSAGAPPSLVTASAGNHGRALAHAARIARLPLTVYIAENAPRTKIDAIRAAGAELVPCVDYDEAEKRAKEHGARGEALFISPYAHPDVIAGAGTVALEILEDDPGVEVIVAAIGGGGLISGIAIAAKDRATVSGAEVSASTPFTHSLAAGRIVSIDVCATVADGLSGNLDADTPTFELVRELVHEIAVVAESEVLEGVRFVAKEERLVIEGAAAVAVAAVRERKISVKGKRTAVVLSGANIDIKTFANILAS